MKAKRLCLLLALIFIASLAVGGCGGNPAEFTVSNLVISPTGVQASDEVEISVTVTNSGGASGSYKADLTVGGAAAGSQTVEVAAGASVIVHFDYTTVASGTLTVTIGGLSGTLTVTPGTGYWDIPYKSIEGSYVTLDFSAGGITPVRKIINLDESTGVTFTMRVNKSVVDGARDVTILKDTWIWPAFVVEGILTGVDMTLSLPIDEDALGILYVEDGKGDVDVSSQSTSGQSPIQVNTYGDGTNDPAGSMLIPIDLLGKFETTVGQDGELPFIFVLTTGHIDNTIHIVINKKMDGKFMESEGVPFAQDGGVAEYTGTSGTITTVGTGECLGIKLVGIRIDVQVEIKFILEPVSD
jgi:hypothetical protein